ncbi:MAG: class I SAM-dependent methyltransferase, partial [Acidobacteriota bacterium]
MIQSTLLHWDYSDLASTYDLRADYCMELVNDILQDLGLKEGDPVLDIGAGTGKLTVHFCKFGLDVVALEPRAR